MPSAVTNWFTDAIHLCARKYCAKANWKILKPPNFARAWRNEFFKTRISFRIYFFCANERASERPPLCRCERFNLSSRIFRARDCGGTLSCNFLLISCLVSIVLWHKIALSSAVIISIYPRGKSWVKCDVIHIGNEKYDRVKICSLKERDENKCTCKQKPIRSLYEYSDQKKYSNIIIFFLILRHLYNESRYCSSILGFHPILSGANLCDVI